MRAKVKQRCWKREVQACSSGRCCHTHCTLFAWPGVPLSSVLGLVWGHTRDGAVVVLVGGVTTACMGAAQVLPGRLGHVGFCEAAELPNNHHHPPRGPAAGKWRIY